MWCPFWYSGDQQPASSGRPHGVLQPGLPLHPPRESRRLLREGPDGRPQIIHLGRVHPDQSNSFTGVQFERIPVNDPFDEVGLGLANGG